MEDDSAADAVGFIRESTRSLIKLHRKSQRDEVTDSRRLLTNTTRTDPKEVAKISNKLKTKSPVTVQELRNLKNTLLECDGNTEIVLNTHGALRGLVRELSGHDPEKQYQAAGCCCNLALHDEKACWTVAKAAGPYLVNGLDSLHSEFQLTCIWALGNLSCGRRASEVLQAQGAVAKLAARAAGAARGGESGRERGSEWDAVLYALEHLVLQLEERLSPEHVRALAAGPAPTARLLAALSRHPAFPSLQELDETFLFNTLAALSEQLAKGGKCHELSSDNCNVSSENSGGDLVFLVRILANVCFEPRVCDMVVSYLVEKDLGTAFKNILSGNDLLVRESVMWLLGNLLNFSTDSLCKSSLFNVVCS